MHAARPCAVPILVSLVGHDAGPLLGTSSVRAHSGSTSASCQSARPSCVPRADDGEERLRFPRAFAAPLDAASQTRATSDDPRAADVVPETRRLLPLEAKEGFRLNIDALMLRADEEVLQALVGQSTVRLLNMLEPGLAAPGRLRALIARSRSRLELIDDVQTRSALLDLLPLEEARVLARLLDLDPKNPFPQFRSMKVPRGSRRYRDLLAYLGVDLPPADTDLPAPAKEMVAPLFGMFPHQRRAIRDVLTILNGSRRRVLLHMPTGSGKTRTAMHVVADILRRDEPSVVVWLAYSDELCAQAAEEFARAWHSLGDREIPIHRHWGEHAIDLDTVRDGFLVAGLSKTFAAARLAAQPLLRLADRSRLVVIDEAHQAIAKTYRFLLEVLIERDSDSRLLGLSATPGRTWNDPAKDKELSSFFFQQKVTLKVEGYENPVDYLVANGYLARPEFRSLTYAGGTILGARDLQDLEDSLDIPEALLLRLADDEQRTLRIVQEVERLGRVHRRIIVFATTVAHSLVLASVLSARGLDAHAITANTPTDRRRKIIADFKSDGRSPMVLCNYGVLTAGFDAPATSAALIARPTKSLVLYSQMVGRATRGTLAGGNEKSEIVTVVDTSLPGFGDMGQAFNNWEDVW